MNEYYLRVWVGSMDRGSQYNWFEYYSEEIQSTELMPKMLNNLQEHYKLNKYEVKVEQFSLIRTNIKV